jgi:glycerol-3-phosphate dehydrogenase/nicotinamidase-related amidase
MATSNGETGGETKQAEAQGSPLSLPFEHWNRCGSERLEGAEFSDFVKALEGAAFRDGKNHDGWVAYQTSAILRLFASEGATHLTKQQFEEMQEKRPLTLFTKEIKRIAVLGAGAFGIAMAVAVSSGGHQVRLLVTSSRTDEQLKASGNLTMAELARFINEHKVYPTETPKQRKIAGQLPPGYCFPTNLTAVSTPAEALSGVEYVVSAAPAQGTHKMMMRLKDDIPLGVPIVVVSKGICSQKYRDERSNAKGDAAVAAGQKLARHPTYMKTMDQVIDLALGEDRNPIVALAGPSFAKFICYGEPTAVTVACRDEAVARDVAQVFSTPHFKCFYTTDVVGAEVSGALKNVVAIACGMCIGCPKFNLPAGLGDGKGEGEGDEDGAAKLAARVRALQKAEFKAKKGGSGLSLGPNATAMLLTRAWEDVRIVCTELGARSETLLSLSGLGDLMLTCYGGESRNAKFGGILGMASLAPGGKDAPPPSRDNPTLEFVLENDDIYPVSEGYYTSLALQDMAKQLNLELPVLSKICDVLQGAMRPQDLIGTIMTEPITPEFDREVQDKRVVKGPGALHVKPSHLHQRSGLLRRLGLNLEDEEGSISTLRQPSSVPSVALVMIEYQNEFAAEGGKMHDAVRETMAHTGMLAKSIELLDEARDAGCTVIHAPIMFRSDNSDNPNPSQPGTILHGCADGGLFKKDSSGAAYVEGMAPKPGDLEVSNKRGLDTFSNTNLAELLQACQCRTIALCGFLTSCCVESTMRSAYERGFNVITITDCTADTSLKGYEAAVDGTFKLFSTPMTKHEFVQNVLK